MPPETFRIRSMTGFGHGSAEGDGVRIDVEIKGVNHRYLDLKLKLPAELAGLEPEVRAQVQAAAGRGRLEVAATLASAAPPAYRLEVRRGLVSEYLDTAAALKREFGLRGRIALEQVLSLPGALTIQQEPRVSEERSAALLKRALSLALEMFDGARRDEGERLVRDLRDRLEEIGREAERIETESRGLPQAYAERLRERVAALVRDRGLDEVRMAQEVALLAGRVDTTEELVRLRGHLDQARATLDAPAGPVGKVLDFLMQEMNREANTIAAKAESLLICQAALRIKSSVERIREQVQNLE